MENIIAIVGYAALLLWGTHMVTSGVLRGFGAFLRERLARSVANPVKAFAAGLGITVALQSSTATGLMAASFTAEGLVALSSGFLIMLGANVGTALVARALSFPIVVMAPAAFLFGVALFRRSRSDRERNVGRIVIGLGLMLLALHLLVERLAPINADPLGLALEHWVFQQPWLTLLASAILAWLCHSSMAVVLMAGALAHAQGLPADVAVALMLGANMGGAIPPVMEVSSVAARRLPVGNLLVRSIGCLVVLGTAPAWVPWVPSAWTSQSAFVVDTHVLFNVVLALLFFPCSRLAGRVLQRWMPDPPQPEDPGQPCYLDEDVVDQCHLALVQAERETVRMADRVEAMVGGAMDVLKTGDALRAVSLEREERAMSRLGLSIRRYLARLPSDALTGEETARRQDIQQFVVDLEGLADMAANYLASQARRHKKERVAFSEAQWAVMERVATEVRAAFRWSLAVFVAQDLKAARALIQNKKALREVQREAASAAASAGDTFVPALRDLKKAHSLLAGVAYRALEHTGELRSRLADPAADPADSVP